MTILLRKTTLRKFWPLVILLLFGALFLGFTLYQQSALAAPGSPFLVQEARCGQSPDFIEDSDDLDGDQVVIPCPEPPKDTSPINDVGSCKMLEFPEEIVLGESFEVCFIGNKFSQVILRQLGPLTPLEDMPYVKQNDDGQGMHCHTFYISPYVLDPGIYDLRCTGPGGTALERRVLVSFPTP